MLGQEARNQKCMIYKNLKRASPEGKSMKLVLEDRKVDDMVQSCDFKYPESWTRKLLTYIGFFIGLEQTITPALDKCFSRNY